MSSNAPKMCQVVIGMLVPRLCGEKAHAKCAKCDRGYCSEHGGGNGQCRHCADGVAPPATILDVPAELTFTSADLEKFTITRSSDPNDAWADLT